MKISALIFLALLGSMTLTLRAQDAAPPTVDLSSPKNQEAVPTPTPSVSSSAPELSQLDEIFKQTSLGKEADERRLHVEWRQLANRVANDPEVVAARATAERAGTDLKKRQRLRDYYDVYYGRMRAMATTVELKAAVDGQRMAHLNQSKQPRVRPATDAPSPTPPSATAATPTPKPKHAKKKHHGVFGGQ
jgi:hypothetical protein